MIFLCKINGFVITGIIFGDFGKDLLLFPGKKFCFDDISVSKSKTAVKDLAGKIKDRFRRLEDEIRGKVFQIFPESHSKIKFFRRFEKTYLPVEGPLRFFMQFIKKVTGDKVIGNKNDVLIVENVILCIFLCEVPVGSPLLIFLSGCWSFFLLICKSSLYIWIRDTFVGYIYIANAFSLT